MGQQRFLAVWVRLAVVTTLTLAIANCSSNTTVVTVADGGGGGMDAVTDTGVDVPPVDVQRRCGSNADCMGNPAGGVCDTTSGACVGCATTPDTCAASQHCDPISRTCAAGCSQDTACATGGGGDGGADGGVPSSHCDPLLHTCVQCVSDGQCPSGLLCRGSTCVVGCSDAHGCTAGQACCGGGCVDTQRNTANCGMCGNTCQVANGAPGCATGACTIASCTAPYADCNGMASDGCETNTQIAPANCGMCGMACPTRANAAPTCTRGACGFTCSPGFADCNADPSDGCEVDIRSSTANCGGCGVACAPPNATGACVASACTVGTCTTGYGDCDRMPGNGCEANTSTSATNCGMCGMACPGRPNAAPACAAGVCGATCNPGFAHCSATLSDGCEVNTGADVNNCGGCGIPCSIANGTAGCVGGACTVATCATGFADCNGLAMDGCEANTATSATNCGGCRMACIPGPQATATCTAGACVRGCSAGYGDCNGSPADGCEVNTNVNPSNCGACGHACPSGQICSGGSCSIPCPGIQVPCSGACVDIETDVRNCGGCGVACPSGSICAFSQCRCMLSGGTPTSGVYCAGACVDVGNDRNNCGTCGHACPSGSSCTGGSCHCATGGTACSSGCVDLTSDASNCGACGHACTAPFSCNASMCNCPGGGMVCGGACAMTQSDVSNCGACGNVCAAGQRCNSGVCTTLISSYRTVSPVPGLTWLDACAVPGHGNQLNSQDDCAGTAVTLPFSFLFYDTMYTQVTPTADGYVLFGTPTSAMNQCSYGTTTFPTTSGPRPAVFAYNRDLYQRGGGVCTAVFGTAPNRRFVLETLDAYNYGDGMVTHLTFEVILNEGTNTIDIVYNTLSGPGSSGDQCTVALQNAAGTVATTFEHTTAGTIASGTTVRFTP